MLPSDVSNCSANSRYLVLPDRCFGHGLDGCEPPGERLAIGVQPPVLDHPDGDGIEIEMTRSALLLAGDEPGLLQHGEVVHHRDAADIEFLRQRADRAAGLGLQDIQHLPPALMRERLEDRRHVIICKHVITYLHIWM